MTPRLIQGWAAVALLIAGGIGGAYLRGSSDARPASYAERPPAAFQKPAQARVVVMPTLEALDAECRSAGFPIGRGQTFVECVLPTSPLATILLPPFFRSPAAMGDALIHALGHVNGWSPEHDNGGAFR